MPRKSALQSVDYTDDVIAEKLHETFGNLQATARVLRVTRSWLEKRVDESDFLQEALRQAREEMLDIGEASLMQMVASGSFPAVSFLLQTAGKTRGYTKRSEITGANGVPLGVDGALLQKIIGYGYDVNDILRAVVAQLEREAGKQHASRKRITPET